MESEEITLAKLAGEYSKEAKARELLELWRWPNGAKCPHCKANEPYRLKPASDSRCPVRSGVWKCRKCRKQFTVTVGTILERSHIPISQWMMSVFILCSSKKSLSASQLSRMLGVKYQTAWFIFHRIRHAMEAKGGLLTGTVEADDAYIGGTPEKGKGTSGRGTKHKKPIVALIQRGGDVRTKVVAGVSHKNLKDFVSANVDKEAVVNTDQWNAYKPLFRTQSGHSVVKHSAGEFSRTEPDGSKVHVNSCESFFSLLKRGVYGAWHHVSKEHLHRYVDEFEFRWNHRKLADGERMKQLISQIEGRRLMYREAIKSAL